LALVLAALMGGASATRQRGGGGPPMRPRSSGKNCLRRAGRRLHWGDERRFGLRPKCSARCRGKRGLPGRAQRWPPAPAAGGQSRRRERASGGTRIRWRRSIPDDRRVGGKDFFAEPCSPPRRHDFPPAKRKRGPADRRGFLTKNSQLAPLWLDKGVENRRAAPGAVIGTPERARRRGLDVTD